MASTQKQTFLGRWGMFLSLWIVLLGVAVLLAERSRVRLDLTDGEIYTISPQSERILASLGDQVVITYYVSSKIPAAFANLRRDTVDMLEEYEDLSDGRVEVRVVDPNRLVEEHVEAKREEARRKKAEAAPKDATDPAAAAAAAEDGTGELAEEEELRFAEEKKQELAQKGIPELQGRSYGVESFSVQRFYSSIEVRYLDRPAEVIAQHTQLEALEYELASRIVKLTSLAKPKVAFFLGNPAERIQAPPDPRMPFDMPPRTTHPYEPFLRQVLGTAYEIVEIELTESSPIPEDAKLLVVAEPHALSERQVYEIDRSIARGRGAILLVSRTTGDLENPQEGLRPLAPNLEKLLGKWGVTLGGDIISSKACGTVAILREGPLGLQMQQMVPFPLCPVATPRGLSQESPLTQGLPGLVFPFASELRFDDTALASSGLTLTRLATSSESWLSAWRPDLDRGMLDPPTGGAKGEFLLAALLEGSFPTAFAAGSPLPPWAPPEPPADGEAPPPEPATTGELVPELEAAPGRVIIVGSADLAKFSALQMYQRSFGNIPFLLGAVETMALGQDLVKIRAKTQVERPLRKTTRGERNLAIYGNLAGVPLLILFLGIARFIARRSRARGYEARVSGTGS